MSDSAINFGIIAAGEGSRLKNEGIDTPKALTEISGKPLIGRLAEICCSLGAREIYAIINEQSPEIRDYLDNLASGLRVNYIIKSTPSSLHSFYELSKTIPSGPLCLFTVDTIFRPEEFREFIGTALSLAAAGEPVDGIMAVTNHVDDEKPLWIEVGEDGLIKAFRDDRGGCSLVSGGIYLFLRKPAAELEEAVAGGMSRMRNFQRFLLDSGYRLKSFRFSKIIDVDHKDDIEKAERFLAEE